MTWLRRALLAFALLWISCAHSELIPDATIPHQVSRETSVRIWVQQPGGKLLEQEVKLPKGWWIAGPPVVDEPAGLPTTFN